MLSAQGKGIHGVKDEAKKPSSAVNSSAHLPVAAVDFWKRAIYARNYKLWSDSRKVLLWKRHATRDCIQFYTQKGWCASGWHEFTLSNSKA